ncbi:hypothetical protein B0H14DRAFT_2584625 [Mycena olivaceomarginata]|nr:hypothetical protein B0H14DRAFT_2584625 [Mycena olivaceomarginata]
MKKRDCAQTIDLFLAIPHAFHRIEVSLLREKSPQYKKDSDPISPKVVHAARSSMKLYRRAGEKSHARTPTPASPPEEPEMPADLDADTGLMGVDPPVDHGPSPAPTAAHILPTSLFHRPAGQHRLGVVSASECNEPADCIGQLGVGDLGLVPPSSSPVPTSPQMNPSFPIEDQAQESQEQIVEAAPPSRKRVRPSIFRSKTATGRHSDGRLSEFLNMETVQDGKDTAVNRQSTGHEGPNPASSKLKSLLGMAQDAHIDYGACLNLRKFCGICVPPNSYTGQTAILPSRPRYTRKDGDG